MLSNLLIDFKSLIEENLYLVIVLGVIALLIIALLIVMIVLQVKAKKILKAQKAQQAAEAEPAEEFAEEPETAAPVEVSETEPVSEEEPLPTPAPAEEAPAEEPAEEPLPAPAPAEEAPAEEPAEEPLPAPAPAAKAPAEPATPAPLPAASEEDPEDDFALEEEDQEEKNMKNENQNAPKTRSPYVFKPAKAEEKPAEPVAPAKSGANGKWVITKDNRGRYGFELFASNGEMMLESGTPYATLASAKSGIKTYQDNIAAGRLEINETKNGTFFVQVLNARGGLLATSADYKTKSACSSAADSIKRWAQTTVIEEAPDEE